MSDQSYFHYGICLFCGQKAGERSFGNHGRETEDVCSCEGRKQWELAKEALRKAAEIAEARHELTEARNGLRNSKSIYLRDVNRIANAETRLAQLEAKIRRDTHFPSEKESEAALGGS